MQEPLFVFCTAYATPMFVKHATDIGVANVFEKPMNFNEVKSVVLSSQ